MQRPLLQAEQGSSRLLEAMPRFELGVRALQAPALPLGYIADVPGICPDFKKKRSAFWASCCPSVDLRSVDGADDGIRTRDPNLGKVVLYQLSHVRAQGVDYHGF